MEAVVPHADAQACRDPIENDGSGEIAPTKREQSSNSARVEDDHRQSDGPIDALMVRDFYDDATIVH